MENSLCNPDSSMRDVVSILQQCSGIPRSYYILASDGVFPNRNVHVESQDSEVFVCVDLVADYEWSLLDHHGSCHGCSC